MRIGVFGRGHVGAALGHALARAGHDVRYGVRTPAEAECEEPGLVPLPEAGRWGEVLILGVPYGAVQEVLHAAGDLDGKIIVDPTNAPKPPTDERSSSQIGLRPHRPPGPRLQHRPCRGDDEPQLR